MLIHLLFSSSDLVFVENPTYFIATKMFGVDAGMTIFSGTSEFLTDGYRGHLYN